MLSCDHALKAWEAFGKVIVTDSCEEMVQVTDDLACDHFEVVTANSEFFLRSMTNYRELFLGSRTNVSLCDKVIGTSYTLPTKKAAC